MPFSSLAVSCARPFVRWSTLATLLVSTASLACGEGDGGRNPAVTPSTSSSVSARPSASQSATAPRPTSSANDDDTSTDDSAPPDDGADDDTAAPDPDPPGMPSDSTENLFVTRLGKTQTEVDTKLEQAVNRFFGIGTGESSTPTASEGYRCYYELPQDNSMAFIWAPDSNDVRSEGMSYGMMIAVQMNMQDQFDRLWKFAQTHMQYPGTSQVSAWRHYFRWQGSVNTSNSSSWSVSFDGMTTPAPDGDEYFAAALYLAHERWGSSAVNYKQEADNIAKALLHNTPSPDGRYPIFHQSQKMVVFVPYGESYTFTDPSYHLPAFYELFALFGPSQDASTWRDIAERSRQYLVDSAHDQTGLHPDYATFQGEPRTMTAGDGHDRFRYDAWRVALNMGLDYAWFSQDARMRTQSEKLHEFFSAHLATGNVRNSLFSVDGSNAEGGGSTALTATLGAAALASDHADSRTFVDNLWQVPQQGGQYRYYQESVYLLGLLAAGGRFSYSW